MNTRIKEGESVTLAIAGAELTVSAALITAMLLERLQGATQPVATGAPVSRPPAIGTLSRDMSMIYAGIARGMDSERDYHLWLLAAKPDHDMPWAEAVKWAEALGEHASLPTRHEQALLYTNLKDQFDSAWYWSGEQYAGDDAYAWSQTFSYGGQNNNRKSSKLRVRAVRRFSIE